VPKPYQIATWNSEKDFWENGEDIFGHSDVYSETWPTSGSMRNGVAYEHPTWEPRTDDSESSSLLGTPRCADGMRHDLRNPEGIKNGNARARLEDQISQLLPTPTTRDHKDNTIRREPHRPNDTDTLARALTGVNTPGLYVDGKPCMEPRLPL